MPRNEMLYLYKNSDSLNMDIAVAKDGSHLITEDGTSYSKKEIAIIKQSGKIDPKVHMVKRIFKQSVIIGFSKVQPKSLQTPRKR